MDLRTLFEHARTAVPFYSGRLPPPGVPLPDDVDALLARLPLLSRQDLRRDGLRLQAQEGDRSTWRVMRTTGTTGEPAEIILDAEAQTADALVLAEHIDHRLGHGDWRRGALLHVALHPEATSRSQPAPWDGGGVVTKWNLSPLWCGDDDTFLRGLARITGQVLTALPSVVELLARRVREIAPGGPIRPALIVLSGQMIENEQRVLLAEVFACPVTSLYVLAESGIIGRECPTGGYHIEAAKAVVEIVDESGNRVSAGEGEVVVTPLANRAMPLLRYRTGDRARFLAACSCGLSGPRLELTNGRRPGRLLTTRGAAVETLRFAKLLAGLEVEQFAFSQSAAGTVTVSYRAREPLGPAAAALVVGCLRAALGPATEVRLEHERDKQFRNRLAAIKPAGCAEPGGPSLNEMAEWLRNRLSREEGPEAVLLTGSALDPEAMTRFSDIDLALVFRRDFHRDRWLTLATELRQELPRLSVHPQIGPELSKRAPLYACRLRCEHRVVAGDFDETLVPWPAPESLHAEARFWLNTAAATMWQRATEAERLRDPIAEACFAVKFFVNALRYRYLCRGERATSARAVLARAEEDSIASSAWFAELREAVAVSREHRPPPVGLPALMRRCHAAVLDCLRTIADDIDP
jgi:phenylacetate-coenzyme A ligase PaaK-like adenylate-forming protein